jgi:hypothetical protein
VLGDSSHGNESDAARKLAEMEQEREQAVRYIRKSRCFSVACRENENWSQLSLVVQTQSIGSLTGEELPEFPVDARIRNA